MGNIFGLRPRRPGDGPRDEPGRREPEGTAPVTGEIHLDMSTETPRTSRDYANQLLCAVTSLPSRVIDDVTITISELVTASYVAGASIVDLSIEVHADHVAATVRDDRQPDRPVEQPAASLREMLLDAMTSSRVVRQGAGRFVTAVRFSLRSS